MQIFNATDIIALAVRLAVLTRLDMKSSLLQHKICYGSSPEIKGK
jgi:hypothetical protein